MNAYLFIIFGRHFVSVNSVYIKFIVLKFNDLSNEITSTSKVLAKS